MKYKLILIFYSILSIAAVSKTVKTVNGISSCIDVFAPVLSKQVGTSETNISEEARERLSELYQKDPNFRKFAMKYFNRINEKAQGTFIINVINSKNDFLGKIKSNEMDDYLIWENAKQLRFETIVKELLVRQFEVLSFFPFDPSCAAWIEEHFINMIDATFHPKSDSIYVKNKFISIMNGWLGELSDNNPVEIKDFFSLPSIIEPLKKFALDELKLKDDNHTWGGPQDFILP